MHRQFQFMLSVVSALLLSLSFVVTTALAEEFSFSTQAPGKAAKTAPDAAVQAPGGAGAISFTQSTDLATITQFNSVSCQGGGLHTDNSYYRRFALKADHGLFRKMMIESVDIGIEDAVGSGGSQPVEVRLYAIAPGDPLLLANFTLLGTASFDQPDTALAVQNFPVSGIIDPSKNDLVVELFTPNGQATGNRFFIGSNSLGQTAPSYIMAADCGVAAITDLANIGFPSMHIVMTVFADTVFPWVEFNPATTGAGAK